MQCRVRFVATEADGFLAGVVATTTDYADIGDTDVAPTVPVVRTYARPHARFYNICDVRVGVIILAHNVL